MKTLSNLYKKIFDCKSAEQYYLESSVDSCDLERRQKLIMKGQAPFQQVGNFKAKNYGW